MMSRPSVNGEAEVISIGERIVSTGKTAFGYDDNPILIKPFSDRKIVMVASGQQHSLALNEDGYLWAWGTCSSDGIPISKLIPYQVLQVTDDWVSETRKIGEFSHQHGPKQHLTTTRLQPCTNLGPAIHGQPHTDSRILYYLRACLSVEPFFC